MEKLILFVQLRQSATYNYIADTVVILISVFEKSANLKEIIISRNINNL